MDRKVAVLRKVLGTVAELRIRSKQEFLVVAPFLQDIAQRRCARHEFRNVSALVGEGIAQLQRQTAGL